MFNMKLTSAFVLTLVILIVYNKDKANAARPIETPGEKGRAIAAAVTAEIEDNNLFPEDFDFLLFLTCIETLFGNNPTIAPGTGGIWKVPQTYFDETQSNTDLEASRVQITTVYPHINWGTINYNDLDKPLYSGLAAALYLKLSGISPATTKKQGKLYTFWTQLTESLSEFYNSNCKIEILGDPHVCQRVKGSSHALCYDVTGNAGDVLKFIEEPSAAGLVVSAKLLATSTKSMKNAKWLGKVITAVDSMVIDIDLNGIHINNRTHFDWNRRLKMYLNQKQDILLQLNKNAAIIRIQREFWIRVTKRGRPDHLDLNIDHMGPFSETSKGILGDVARYAEIVETDYETHVVISNKYGEKEYLPLTKYRGHWKLTPKLKSNRIKIQSLVDENKL